MLARSSSALPPSPSAPLREPGGFIVLGLLIVIALSLGVGVLAGRVVHASRWAYEVPPGPREARAPVGLLEVRYGALVTARIEPDEPVWVRPVGGGRLAVFAGASSSRVLGFVEESELPPGPLAPAR